MQYSREQQIAFNQYKEGKNVFVTGPGGTGKTALIRYIQQDAQKRAAKIQVCALTGCAAVLLQCKAKTIHSWAGIGLGNASADSLIKKLFKNNFYRNTWQLIDILVIDEVSMMSKKIFELLDAIGKGLRRNSKPFGGIQLIFSGDFYQLPPVGKDDDEDSKQFCFQSSLWFETFHLDNHIQLTHIFRQSDPIYQKILNQIREGRLTRTSNTHLLANIGKKYPEDCLVRPTKLFPTRSKVDFINVSEMSKLTGPLHSFELKFEHHLEITAKDKPVRSKVTQEQIQFELNYLKGTLRCDEIVNLKAGAQVMCICNIELTNGEMICNGAQGVVVDFLPEALGAYPIVRYKNGYQMPMCPKTWTSENIPGIGISQVPLILAWALTIHKAQGSTLDIAEVDVGREIFECGQTYVALSRVKSLEGLYLSGFDASKIRVNKSVQAFYLELAKKEPEVEVEIEPKVEPSIVVPAYSKLIKL
jgi:ATP-dependent DNA helicase PIF1